jgi:peptidoglycan/LPS O-acetylase OafA/YrhL
MQDHIRSLTGIRFLASAAIVLHHSPYANISAIPLSSAVPLFFVLSGFVLAVNSSRYVRNADFFVARVARVWPAHLAAIAFFIYLWFPYTLDIFSADQSIITFANIFLLQAWWPDKTVFYSINGPAWSVSCEIFFYITFPWLVRWLRSHPLEKAFLAYISTLGVLMIIDKLFPVEVADLRLWLSYINPLTNLSAFILGTSAGLTFQFHRTNIDFKRASGLQFNCLIGICVLSIVAINARQGSWLAADYFGVSGCTPLFALLLFALSYDGVISRLLSCAPIVYLGEISYSIYLFHQLILRWIFTQNPLFADLPIRVQFFFYILLTLLVSVLVYHCVEKPARQLIRAVWRRISNHEENSPLKRQLASPNAVDAFRRSEP